MNPSIKKQLKQRAHSLKPVVQTGAKGLTEAVHAEIDVALNAHELIKIKLIAGDKPTRQTMITSIITQHQAELIQDIGHTLTIYRENDNH